MRRKSERTATKKSKTSPEKKMEKVKRGRGRRRKHSSSSGNESVEETASSVQETETIAVTEVGKKTPQKVAKEDSPEDSQEQVWQVKAAQTSGDIGEIQKLKICLTRPPSTPERVDRSPRSKRKHSRATSSSDTPSIEAVEEKKKTKHRSKRITRESKDGDKNHDSHGEENDTDGPGVESSDKEVSQSEENTKKASVEETPMSTTGEENAKDDNKSEETTSTVDAQKMEMVDNGEIHKSSDADTTVASPDHTKLQSLETYSTEVNTSDIKEDNVADALPKKNNESDVQDDKESDQSNEADKAVQEESPQDKEPTSQEEEVSKSEDVTDNHVIEEAESTHTDNIKTSNETDVVESSEKPLRSPNKEESRKMSTDSNKDKPLDDNVEDSNRQLERSESIQSSQSVPEENVENGQAAPIVINRKRRWGSRANKLTSQKSITISTDVLKDIIPDVKPVEFEEVIEEKKHKRVEVTEKIERPVLPKIVIDNTENMQHHRKNHEDEKKEKDNVKLKESHLASNRKISIIKDSDSIIARPPSPPRHKQSNILYITNLVRPFTLLQLKNLLQRTGRIMENGFWIDKIKSKCFVKYETEDQAVETRHALHGVTWPVSNPKTLQVDFSTHEAFDKAKLNEDADNAQTSTIPGTVEDWLREQDMKRERGELDKPWERKAGMREWDVGKNEKDKDKIRKDERPLDKRRHRTPDRSPEPARKFKKKEEEAPAKLLDDLFRKTKATPCIYWLPLSDETIAIKEEQRRQHMAEHERRMQELRRTHRRH